MLGIDQDGVDVYEGGTWLHAVYPPPILTLATIPNIGDQLTAPNIQFVMSMPIIFREDSFDPTSRIKRGRLYRKDNTQPHNCYVYPHPARQTEMRTHHNQAQVFNKSLVVFYPHQISHELKDGIKGSQLMVLGTASAYSVWRIVDIERIHNGEELITLRSIRSLGSMPRLKIDALPEASRAKIEQATETLISEIHTSAPESVIDRARDLLAVSFAAYLDIYNAGRAKADLSEIVRQCEKLEKDNRKYVAENAARIVALLHARSKSTEQSRRNTRKLMEQDADLAVACVGTSLCDFGWAEWQ